MKQNPPVYPRIIHVSKTGNDEGPGNHQRPFLTIRRAAEVARPGDTVTVHKGIYRESVCPVRGGTSNRARITYRAAAGERVSIRGSERITGWIRKAGGVWKVRCPNTLFGDYNPYRLTISGPWLNYGAWHHRGDIYLNGVALREVKAASELGRMHGAWHARAGKSTTTILAHFGNLDPNREEVEINVRESLFMPKVTGLNYITVAGFDFRHAAPNWAPPTIELQAGAVGPRMGKEWIIEHCTIEYSRCVGIILGMAPGTNHKNIDLFGGHIVRHNVIRHCGQAGIAGQRGATRCEIVGNLIEETNDRKEFGGWETAAIKFHQSVDTVIRGNLIRGVYKQIQGAYGIWVDFGNQGTRITGNIIHHTMEEAIFLEMDHGPTLIDNNIMVGGGIRSNSKNTVFAHNLLVDFPFNYVPDGQKRRSEYYRPHTGIVVGREPAFHRGDQWYHNLFIRSGLDRVPQAPGFVSNFNVFYEGAIKSSFGDAHSKTKPLLSRFSIKGRRTGTLVSFSVKASLLHTGGPQVNSRLVGVFPMVKQTIEDRDGRPIRVDTDFLGYPRRQPLAGPLADPKTRVTKIGWSMKKPRQ